MNAAQARRLIGVLADRRESGESAEELFNLLLGALDAIVTQMEIAEERPATLEGAKEESDGR